MIRTIDKKTTGQKNWLIFRQLRLLGPRLLNVLVSYISVFHNFGFGKVSPAKQLYIHQVGFVNPRHFSKTEVVKNTDLRI